MSSNIVTKQVIDQIIKYLSAGGNITISKDRSNLTPFLKKDIPSKLPTKKRTAFFKQLLRYLRQQNMVTFSDLPKGKIKLRLATAGIRRAQKISLDELSIPRPRRWDRRWRLVIFDIPETHRQARNKLTLKLRELGFYQLQKSAWIFPFPCLIEIEYLKRHYGISSFVTLAEIAKIDQQPKLIRHFRRLFPPSPKKIA